MICIIYFRETYNDKQQKICNNVLIQCKNKAFVLRAESRESTVLFFKSCSRYRATIIFIVPHLFGIILYYLVYFYWITVLCTKLKIKKASLCKQQATTLIKIILLPFEKIQMCEGEVWQIKSTWHIIRDTPPLLVCVYFFQSPDFGETSCAADYEETPKSF